MADKLRVDVHVKTGFSETTTEVAEKQTFRGQQESGLLGVFLRRLRALIFHGLSCQLLNKSQCNSGSIHLSKISR